MQLLLQGTTQENTKLINILKRKLKDKIIFSTNLSKNNEIQCIYIEINLQNQDNNYPVQKTDTNIASTKQFIQSSKSRNTKFDEAIFFEEIEKRISQNS